MTRRRPPVRRQDSPVMHTNVASPPDADLGDDAGGGGVRMIPVIGEGYDVCRAACAYAAAGIFVVPIDPRTKNPGSVLGSGWPSKSSRDPQQIGSWFAGTNYGLALHLGRSNLIAFDVDNPSQLPPVLRELFEETDPPFQSTREGEPGRGHAIYQQPQGRCLGNSLGKLPAGWGDVRGGNGVIVVEPTPHSKVDAGGRYRWEVVGEIPVLPDNIADLLPDAMSTGEAATDSEVRTFLATYTEGAHPERLRFIVARYTTRVGAGASRHDTLLGCLTWGCKEVLAGNISARRVTSELRALHVTALADSHHPNGAAPPSRHDFDDALRWALAQARNNPLSDAISPIHAAEVRSHRPRPPHNPQSVPPDAETLNIADCAEVSTGFDQSVPTPLGRGNTLPDFPIEVLPHAVNNMVREVAEATQSDPGMSGTVALGVMATAVGGQVEVHVRPGYSEPTNLFTAIVARPGERKSAICTLMTAPLVDLERELVQNTRSAIVEQRMRKEIADKRVEETKKTAGRSDAANLSDATTEAIAAALHATDITVDAVPQIVADDITLEALGQRLAEQGGRLAIISTEGGFLTTAAGRYKANPDLSVPLKAHAGDRLRVDRIGRATDFVDKPALSMVMMVQPGVLAEASRNSRFHENGLLARFLYAVPPSHLGHRSVNPRGLNPATATAYRASVITIARDSRAATDRQVLTLDAPAHAALLDFASQVEARLGTDGELAHLSGWANKLVGATVRIAGLLHVFSRETEGERIAVESMRGAIKLAEYFTAHALCAFDVMAGGDADLELARRVVGLIGRNPNFTEFTSRDLFSAASRSWMPKMAVMHTALGQLVDYGWVVPLPEPVRSDGTQGRPPSPRYRAHPRCHQEAPQNPHKAAPPDDTYTFPNGADSPDRPQTAA